MERKSIEREKEGIEENAKFENILCLKVGINKVA